MPYLAKKLVGNPSPHIQKTLPPATLNHLLANRKDLEPKITHAFDLNAEQLSDDSFVTAVGLYGLAEQIGKFYTPAKTIKDALDLVPNGLDELDDLDGEPCDNANNYRIIWMIGAGVTIALGDLHVSNRVLLDILKAVHQHQAIGNYDLDIDHLHSALLVERFAAEKCAEFFKTGDNLGAFYDIATDAIDAHIGRAKAQAGDYGLSPADIERINNLDSAVLAVMRFACVNYYDLPVRLNYAGDDILAPFMAVYELFTKYIDRDLFNDIRKEII